jgi:hypothetical protein
MGMPDLVNDIYPVAPKALFIAVDTTTSVGFSLQNFRNGFFIFWGAGIYQDGTYDLEIQESSDGGATGITVPTERIYFPRLLEQAQKTIVPTLNPLQIVAPGGMTDPVSNTSRLIAVKDFATDAIKLNILSTGIGVGGGADIVLMLWASTTLTPTDFLYLPVSTIP